MLLETKLVHYVLGNWRSSRSGKGNHGGLHTLAELTYLQIIRTEVIAPLGNAMRLVHHDVIDLEYIYVRLEQGCGKTFRREVQELEIPVCGIVQGRVHLKTVHTGVNSQGLDAAGFEVLHLVLHQGYQGRDNQGYAVLHKGRHLETDRFSTTGRKDGQDVTVFQGGGYYLLLLRAEAIVTPVLLQDILRIHTGNYLNSIS